MALNAFLELVGFNQGRIEGSSTVSGQERKIIVHAVKHRVKAGQSSGGGISTGIRQHKPIVITKEIDRSTPLLYNALVMNEIFTDFKLQFFEPSASGQEENHYTIQLFDVSIRDIRFTMPNNKIPELMPLKEYEQIAFNYQKIIWTWEDGGITAEDDWQIPRK